MYTSFCGLPHLLGYILITEYEIQIDLLTFTASFLRTAIIWLLNSKT
jgi:hypothetical protein